MLYYQLLNYAVFTWRFIMGKGGKYLKQAEPVKKKKNKVVSVILFAILALLLIGIGFAVWYYNYLIGLVSRPDTPVRVPEQTVQIDNTVAETELLETEPATTSPEDTWPEIVSDENITNIMLVGQASRQGEESLIADTMILVSINRETKTLTLTSLMRDLRLTWPKYVDTNGKTHSGFNRINMAYNMGYSWTKNKQDSMDLMEAIVEYNFGVPVDNTVEIDFEIFMKICDILGGVTLDFSEEEIKYMQTNYFNYEKNFKLVPGENKVDGWQALCYARMRKVGHGDFERTERQREVITNLLNKLRKVGILDIHKMFTEVLPMITTDMTNEQITNYAFEFIPMLKDLKIQSQRIPFDGTYWSVVVEIEGQAPDNQIDCNAAKNGELLRASIGMTEPTE